MKLYSWKDVERFLYSESDKWKDLLNGIEVYPDTVFLYKNAITEEKKIEQCLNKLLPTRFRVSSEGWKIHLDLGDVALSVIIEENDIIDDHPITPIFRDILYRKSSYPTEKLTPLPCPVIAFHSYKGGVGRTLSLLAFARAWSECFENKKQCLLIVDADIEAPGLTWLNQENMGEDCFSYLDLLDILQDAENTEKVVTLAATKLYGSNIEVMTDKQIIKQKFLPTYRYAEQLLDMYATPNTIVNTKGKRYALTDTLSQLGQKLGASAVLVDLRAGLSDYSSTLLFDPRVKKYLVTSTSEQSVKGTELLLNYLNRGLEMNQDTVLPEIFLNMIMSNLDKSSELEYIIDRLKNSYYKEDIDDNNAFVDNFLIQLPFASELIHLSSLKQIFQLLSDRIMFNIIKDLIKVRYDDENISAINGKKRQDALLYIYNLAKSQITAENDSEFKVLMTKPLQFLLQKYVDTIPQTIIMGAKGAGKTFLYKQMIQEKRWDNFCNKIQANTTLSNEAAYFLPVLTSQSLEALKQHLQDCITNCNSQIPSVNIDSTTFVKNVKKLKQYKDEHPTLKESQWEKFWEEFLAKAINPKFSTLQEVNQSLKKDNKKIILLFDGLEEVFKNVGTDDSEKLAISSLCKDIINQLVVQYPYIGIIIFLRYDMAQDAISVNFAQFKNMYERYSLKWSQEEALRLALWLVDQAAPDFLAGNVNVVTAARTSIEEHLTRLWGLKLGKKTSNEAYTSRWILAALSDFNGQLQARDIIRFLMYATKNKDTEKKISYNDRYIMPQDVRDAVIECSKDKIEEIEQEYHVLKPIFEKLQKHETKTLPLTEENNPLELSERKKLEDAGFLKKDGNKYYLPEIIRHALGYRYEKGARPKVLSLLIK